MTAAVLACAASIVSAQTVTSANIVGYTKVEAVGGQLVLAALNFETGGSVLTDFIPNGALPASSAAFLWNKDTGAYVSSSVNARGNWNNDFAIATGDALWIQAGGSGTNEIILPGEVITVDTDIPVTNGIVATGYFFPVETLWQSTDLSAAMPNGSVVHVWDAGLQSYASATKNARGTWNANPVIGPSSGFWIENSGAATNVTETVPFTP